MIYDSAVTACCVDELAGRLDGARIAEVHQPRRLEVCLEVEAPGRRWFLVASAEPSYARLTLARSAPPRVEAKYPLGVFARKHLRGAAIEGVAQVGFDRIVRIAVEPRNPRLVDPVRFVVVEIMGKHSNIVLLNNVDMVLAAAKHVTADVSRGRTMLPHDEYVLPPTHRGADPRELDDAGWGDLLRALPEDRPVSDALCGALQGANRLPITEALSRADIAPGTERGALTEGDLYGVARTLSEVYASLTGVLSPVRWRNAKGIFEAYPIALGHQAAGVEAVDSLALAIEDAVLDARTRAEADAVARAARSTLQRARKSLEERKRKTERSRRPEEEVELLRQTGDSILAALWQIPPREAVVEIPNVHSPTGEMLRVELDPSLGPQGNAERLFRRYKHARVRNEHVPRLLAQVDADLAELAELERRLDSLPPEDAGESAALLADHRLTRLLRQSAQRGRDTDGGRFLSRTSADGFEMLIGRSAAESDEMLRRAATPDDLWLHARDQHGGHVVIRTNRHPERVPMATILEAARLAAYYSKSKHSSLVPVDYTLKKHVHRARKGAPGLQIYENAKTVMVEPWHPEERS